MVDGFEIFGLEVDWLEVMVCEVSDEAGEDYQDYGYVVVEVHPGGERYARAFEN